MSQKQEAPTVRSEALLHELTFVYDIPLQVAIEVGRVRMRLRDLIKIAVNSVIELKKPAGEPFEVCINGVFVGRGEVVVAEQVAGVRIVEIHKSGALML